MGLLDMFQPTNQWAANAPGGFGPQPSQFAQWMNANPYALSAIGQSVSAIGRGMVGHGSDMGGLVAGINDAVTAAGGPIAENMALQRQQNEQAKQVKAAQQQQNKTVAWLQQKGQKDLADAVQNGLVSGADAFKLAMTPGKTQDLPAAIQEYQYAVGQGYKGTLADYQKELRRAAATNIDFNANQGVAAGYADRMQAANQVLADPKLLQAMTDATKPFVAGIPVAGNFMVGPEYQMAEQAQRDFLNAILRRESGAVISPSEFDNAKKQYFPQPGDSAEVIKQKAQNRELAIQGVMRSAGPNYAAPQTALPPTGDASTGVPDGVDPNVWQYMTPEEKALWQN